MLMIDITALLAALALLALVISIQLGLLISNSQIVGLKLADANDLHERQMEKNSTYFNILREEMQSIARRH